jgi:hypothetical protein
MKIQKQISYIKKHGRFQPDFWDIILLVSIIFIFIVGDVAIYNVYKQGFLSSLTFLIIEALFIFLTILIPVRYINTFSFQEIQTDLPFEVNKSRIISYLSRKGFAVIYSPTDHSVLMAHIISFSFTSILKEMTVICMDDKILLNIRTVHGKDILNFRKDNKLYKKEIEDYINY